LDPLALFAAAVATASLIWQAYTWLESQRIRVKLEIYVGYDERTAQFENRLPQLKELEASIRACDELRQFLASGTGMDSTQCARYFRQLESVVERYDESPWSDLRSRMQQRSYRTDNLPNIIVVNVFNDGDRDVEVKLLWIIQSGRHKSGRRRNQDGLFPRRINLTAPAHKVAQETVWINTALVSDFELSKKLQIEVQLWSGKKIRSQMVQLGPREFESLVEEKYSKLNERFDLESELKYKLQDAGINSVHDLRRLLNQ
jgi:hypothetical protein